MILTLTTKDLTYSNIKDTSYTETKGFNFSTTIGSDPDKGKANIAPMGSTTIGLKSTGSEKEQETKATIGNGSIVITNKVNGKEIIANEGGTTNQNDLLASLNRNKDNSQQITKDMITGALDGSMTIDNRLLLGFINQNVYERDENGKVKKDADGKSIVMKDKNGNNITTNGYKSIGSDVRNFGGNTSKALSGATTTVINPFYTAYNVISNDKIGMNEIASQWKANQNAGANMININKDVINNLSKGQSIADIQEATGNQVLVYGNENDKVYGFYDNNGKQIYINAESGAVINTDTFVKTYGHETGHKYTKNEEIAKNSGSFGSFIYGLSNMTSFTGVNKDGGATTNSWKQSQMSSWDSADMLVNNSNMAGDVREEDRSDRTVFVHGTFSNPTTFSPEFKKSIERLLGDPNQEDFKWSGDNTDGARLSAALQLLMQVNDDYEYAEGEKLYLVDHSHGGNVAKIFSGMYDYINNPELVVFNFGTPNLDKYQMDSRVSKFYNVYNKNDLLVQDIGGGTDTNFESIKLKYPNLYIPKNVVKYNGNPTQKAQEENAINIEVYNYIRKDVGIFKKKTMDFEIKYLNPIREHTTIQSHKIVDKFLIPIIKEN